jgi:hypothetical protein
MKKRLLTNPKKGTKEINMQAERIVIDEEAMEAKEQSAERKFFPNKMENGEILFRIISPIKGAYEAWAPTPDGEKKKPPMLFRLDNLSAAIKYAEGGKKPRKIFYFAAFFFDTREVKLVVLSQKSLVLEMMSLQKQYGEEDIFGAATMVLTKSQGAMFPEYHIEPYRQLDNKGKRQIKLNALNKEDQKIVDGTPFYLDNVILNLDPFIPADEQA